MHDGVEVRDLRSVGRADAADWAVHVVDETVYDEGVRVEDVSVRESGGVVGSVLVPDGAEDVDVDVGDVHVEDVVDLAGTAGEDEDLRWENRPPNRDTRRETGLEM